MDPDKKRGHPGDETGEPLNQNSKGQQSANIQNIQAQPFGVSTYRHLILDDRLSHGSFRLWHYLRSRADGTLRCWPTQREIASDLGCKPHSLKEWTDRLINAGYLAVETYGPHHNFRYVILGGDGQSALPKWAARNSSRVAENGNTAVEPRCLNGHAALPKEASRRVAGKGILSKSNRVNSISKGESVPLSIMDRISLEGELKRIVEEIKGYAQLSEYAKGSAMHNRLSILLNRQTELRGKLGVVA